MMATLWSLRFLWAALLAAFLSLWMQTSVERLLNFRAGRYYLFRFLACLAYGMLCYAAIVSAGPEGLRDRAVLCMIPAIALSIAATVKKKGLGRAVVEDFPRPRAARIAGVRFRSPGDIVRFYIGYILILAMGIAAGIVVYYLWR